MTTTKTPTKPEPLVAVPIAPGPAVGRCHWCGQPASKLTLVETIGGVERYKCEKCGGARVGH